MYQYMLYHYMLPCLMVPIAGFRCGPWHPPMAHKLLISKLHMLISPVPPIPCLFTGFRCGLWHPPMAHMKLLVLLLVLIPSLFLTPLSRPLSLVISGLSTGFWCRPHLRV
jgi:hypothetical protein